MAQLKIWFDNDVIEIELYSNPVANWLHSRYKHLAHLPLEFDQKNMFFNRSTDRSAAEQAVMRSAQTLGIPIDHSQLVSQLYLNHLHSIYENNFLHLTYKEKSTSADCWTMFHDAVHMLERINTSTSQLPFVSFDYNTRAGHLERPFDRQHLKLATSQLKKNQCFVQWEELGKTPWDYFHNCEPNDIERLCELAKPWLMLRTSFRVACNDCDLLELVNFAEFNHWFSEYQQHWCDHWGLNDWRPEEMLSVIPIGEIHDADRLIAHLQHHRWPVKITQ